MRNDPRSFRIIPAKGTALLIFVIFAVLLFLYFTFLLHDVDTVIINGKDVLRESPYRLLYLALFLVLPVFGLISQGLRLLPGGPFDFMELGPQGFTVGKLFGRRQRKWEETTGYTTGSIALTKPPITWLRLDGVRPLRFFVTGYVRLQLFARGDAQIREIADWLDDVRTSYVSGDGTLPPPPDSFAGTILPLSPHNIPMQTRTNVIERRR